MMNDFFDSASDTSIPQCLFCYNTAINTNTKICENCIEILSEYIKQNNLPKDTNGRRLIEGDTVKIESLYGKYDFWIADDKTLMFGNLKAKEYPKFEIID